MKEIEDEVEDKSISLIRMKDEILGN